MNLLTAPLQPFLPILGTDPMSKREFVKKAHGFTSKRHLVNLLEMIQFRFAHKENGEVVLD